MRQSLAKFSESEASNHTPSLAGFIITMSAFKFSVHTGQSLAQTQRSGVASIYARAIGMTSSHGGPAFEVFSPSAHECRPWSPKFGREPILIT
jgi:hypothetical protein